MGVSPREAQRRSAARQQRLRMLYELRFAFSDVAMAEHSVLVVWTKGQMSGIRAMIRRLGLA